MNFYSILISILRWFPGYVFIVVYVIHGILVVGVGSPPQNCSLGSEEFGDPGGPHPPASVVN